MFASFTILPHLVSFLFNKKIQNSTITWNEKNTNFTKVISDFFKNMWSLKIYNAGKKELEHVEEKGLDYIVGEEGKLLSGGQSKSNDY